MPTLVVTTQGAVVRCREGQVQVEYENRVLETVPQEQVERALLLGSVGLTTAFIQFALDRRIPVTFLTQDGGYRGRLDAGERGDVKLRQAQFRRLDDLDWRLTLSRRIVQTKVAGQRALLMRHRRNHAIAELRASVSELVAAGAMAMTAETLPALMGQEGNAAKIYFRALPYCLRRPMEFSGRSRRPPRDPVNALLSLGYGLLSAEILGALSGVGLDPKVGIFHSSRGRMPALAQDIVEMFRAPVADTLAITLVNLGVMQSDDFTRTEEGGVRLSKAALEVYFRHYRRRMTATYRDREGRKTSLRRELQGQAVHLRRVLETGIEFVPFWPPQGGAIRED